METQFGHDHSRVKAPRVSRLEAKQLLMDGGALFVDVRSVDEYRFSHVPDAINVPLPELRQRLGMLPKERRIITYCT